MTPPRPPADLDARTPLTVTLPPGTALHRFYPAGREPIYLDRSLCDFDEILPAAGAIHSAVRLSPQQLAEITGGEWVEVCLR